jgi:hypothetical protein
MTETPTSPDDPMFAAIGRLATAWSFLEAGIDYSIMFLHSEFGGNAVEPEIPWSLQRKLKYLKKCFRRIERFKSQANAVAELMDIIRTASVMRHDIIHGFAIGHPEGATQLEMIRLLRDKGGNIPDQKLFTVTIEQILLAAQEANMLGHCTIALMGWLLKLVKKKDN